MKKDEWLRLALIKSAGDWAPDQIRTYLFYGNIDNLENSRLMKHH